MMVVHTFGDYAGQVSSGNGKHCRFEGPSRSSDLHGASNPDWPASDNQRKQPPSTGLGGVINMQHTIYN